MKLAAPATALPPADAEKLARSLYGLEAAARRLPGEWDDNFSLATADGATLILKVSHPAEQRDVLELQIAMLRHLAGKAPGVSVPGAVPRPDGSFLSTIADAAGASRFVRLLRFVPGRLMADTAPYPPGLLRSAGGLMAAMDRALLDFEHPAAARRHHWDLRNAGASRDGLAALADPARRRIAERRLDQFDRGVRPALDRVRQSVIHGDPNDYNLIVTPDPVTGTPRATGAIDFGDAVRTATVCDAAIATAYAMLKGRHWLAGDPLADAAQIVSGYDEVLPLSDEELSLIFPLICTRLTVSVLTSARRRIVEPENAYLAVSEAPAWAALERLERVPADAAEEAFRRACGRAGARRAADPGATEEGPAILARRRQRLGPNLSLSYSTPLHIVRGRAQYLYDAEGREYLDAYNNIAHVGHCHPRVVEAMVRQAAVLNTNTRYLHESVARYADRLAALFPDPLEVCYFVNSASEANELALRIARAATGRRDVIVSAGAYHGNTQGLIDVSPYKHLGPGGEGTPPHVHVVALPDVYRGEHRGPDAGARYAAEVAAAAARTPPGAFLIESLPSCGGQIVLPDGYLKTAFGAVRAAGGVCIVDEVQVGFGRVGRHFWGFELQGVVPDIVVLGKPMGNGHPLAGVVTTRALARAFDNGMEYFSSYGGNPVSMAAGLAVLDVLEDENLQAHALKVGDRLLAGLRDLAKAHPEMGDVRGNGLFIGIELVRDPATREPAGARASAVVNALKERGILTGTDGPHHNVIKIKPPMPFDEGNADQFVGTLDAVLRLKP